MTSLSSFSEKDESLRKKRKKKVSMNFFSSSPPFVDPEEWWTEVEQPCLLNWPPDFSSPFIRLD